MNSMQITWCAACVTLGVGLWLLLPRGVTWGRRLGSVVTAVGIALFVSLGTYAQVLPSLGRWVDDAVFTLLAGVTIFSAVATVTFRNPVYCAIWFALTLLGTAGLFLFQGAQFLSVATVVVYAGAILVTFLFVLMLSNPKGRAYYDRLSWEAFFSATAGALVIGILTMSLAKAFLVPQKQVATADPSAAADADKGEQPATGESSQEGEKTEEPKPVIGGPYWVAQPADPQQSAARRQEILASQHMAHLGKFLFSQHLVAVEVAGTLLLVALVGAVTILSQPSQQGADAQARRP